MGIFCKKAQGTWSNMQSVINPSPHLIIKMRQVKRGRDPGPPHQYIYSDKVNYGGLSRIQADKLYYSEKRSKTSRSRAHTRASVPAGGRGLGRSHSRTNDSIPRPSRTNSRVRVQDSESSSHRGSGIGSSRPSRYDLDHTGSAPVRQRPVSTIV